MSTQYRFSINGRIVSPLYGDNLAIETTRESGEMFFRKKLSGSLTFIRSDYDYLDTQPFDTVFAVLVEIKNGSTYAGYYNGEFKKIDCTWDVDSKKVEATITPIDLYTKVLALQDKDFNLIELSPETEAVTIRKRLAIQIYEAGSNVITSYLGGSHFEQPATAISDDAELTDTYKFNFITAYGEWEIKNVVGETYPDDIAGYYVSKDFTISGDSVLRTAFGVSPLVTKLELEFDTVNGRYYCKVYDTNENIVYQTALDNTNNYEDDYVELFATNPGDPSVLFKLNRYINFYGRAICNVDSILGSPTEDLPVDDICGDNLNYNKVVGYDLDTTKFSLQVQDGATKYGKNVAGKYFVEYSSGGVKYIPIGKADWENTSFWFTKPATYDTIDTNSYESMVIKDNYPLYSVVQVLLNAIDTGVSHTNTSAYSTILYGSNPIFPEVLSLMLTPKSNILHNNYDVAAKKANITLKAIFDMLKQCYNIFWFIDSTGKLRLEHILWFQKGGSYSAAIQTQVDLTAVYNKSTSKPWAYGTSKYTFEKEDIPKYIQHKWMEDVTECFNGYDIEMLNVTNEQVVTNQITNFNSDLDYMLLTSANISEDGFALIIPELVGGIYKTKVITLTVDGRIFKAQNGQLAFAFLHTVYHRYNLPNWSVRINKAVTEPYTVRKTKAQEVAVPSITDLDVFKGIKTYLGVGLISKISLNLTSRMNKVTLNYDYDTEPV